MVAGPAGRRLPRRDPHQGPLRHAHLRALGRRGRGHLAVPARAPPQHRRLPVGASARRRAARASSARTTTPTTTSRTTRSADLDPDRQQIDGRTEMRLTVRSAALGTLTLQLAEPLNVYAVVGEGLGRLLALRVRGQNSMLVNLPRTLVRGTTSHADRSPTAAGCPARRRIAKRSRCGRTASTRSSPSPPSRACVYSNRSYWYPQAPVTDYATGVLRLTVPDKRACVASGTPATGNPVRVTTPRGSQPALRLPRQPAGALFLGRGLARSACASDTEVDDADAGQRRGPGQPAPDGRGRALSAQAAAILGVYGDVLGEYPVPDAHAGARSTIRCRAGTARPISRSSTSRCRRRKFTWAQRSGGVRGLPAVLPRARDRAPVLGRRGRLGELPRAMDQRRLRAVLRAALRRALARRRPRRGHPRASCARTATATAIRARSGSAIASATCRTTAASSAPSSTTRARWCCTCCGAGSATRPSSAACARSTPSRATRRSGPARAARLRDGVGRSLARFFESWIRSADTPRLRASFEAAADRCRCGSTSSAR